MHVIGKCVYISYFMPIDTNHVATDSFSAKINVYSAKSYYYFAELDIGGYIVWQKHRVNFVIAKVSGFEGC